MSGEADAEGAEAGEAAAVPVLDRWLSVISGVVSTGVGAFVALMRAMLMLNDVDFTVTWLPDSALEFALPNWLDLTFWAALGIAMVIGGTMQITLVQGTRARALPGAKLSAIAGGFLLFVLLVSLAIRPDATTVPASASHVPLLVWAGLAVVVAPTPLLAAFNWARLRRAIAAG